MKTLVAAAIALALLLVPAQAQDQFRGKRHEKTAPKADLAKRKVTDKEFYEALEKIPDSKEPRDPWRNMRK